MEAPRAADASANPLSGLYQFVRGHLVVVNAIVVASTAFVGAMDFLAPKLSVLPAMVYAATGVLAALMLGAAIAPVFIAKLFALLGFSVRPDGKPSLWRRPGWQFGMAILVIATALGFASVARASEGGLIASKFPEAKRWQASLLSLEADSREIKLGVASANGKLDLIVADSQDPQKDVVARGYAYDYNGLAQAITQGDARAVGLFAKSGLRVGNQLPMVRILVGSQPWSAEIAGLLTPRMFENPEACRDANFLNWELSPPIGPRVATFKRLCDTKEVQERLAGLIESGRQRADPDGSVEKRLKWQRWLLAELQR